MFSELPKLLDRNFAIAFFLPAAALLLAGWGVLHAFEQGPAVEAVLARDALIGAVLAIVLVWLLALLLLALNYPLLRFYQGYGRYHPLRWRAAHQRRRFGREVAPALELQAEIDAARARGESPTVPPGHAERLYAAVCTFPDGPAFVLPTRFGNLVRAFEVYSRVVYELDAVPAWPRLHAVMPEHARSMLADAKAQLDFCINLSLCGWLAFLLYLALAVEGREAPPALWVPLAAAAVGCGSYWMATNAAMNYGAEVKAAFDLYRGELAEQLGLELPPSAEAEREMWRTLSRMMTYRSVVRATELDRFRRASSDR
jgi:hypothetical protein